MYNSGCIIKLVWFSLHGYAHVYAVFGLTCVCVCVLIRMELDYLMGSCANLLGLYSLQFVLHSAVLLPQLYFKCRDCMLLELVFLLSACPSLYVVVVFLQYVLAKTQTLA